MIIRKKRSKTAKEPQALLVNKTVVLQQRAEKRGQEVIDRTVSERLRSLQLVDSSVRKTNPPTSTRLELRGLHLSKYDVVNLLRANLKESPRVGTLDLSWVGLGDENAAVLCRSLQVSRLVKELILCGNDLGQNSSDYLGTFLRKNKSVVKLHLGSNSLGKEAARSLAEGLRENTTLEELDLWNCSLGDEAGALILESAKYAKNLKVLRLNMNRLGSVSLETASQLLDTPTALEVLNLDSNPRLFGRNDETEKKFVRTLVTNTNLRSLGMPYTGASDFTAKLVFQALTTNTCLEYLDIGYNDIFKEGYDMMVECIPKMKTLKHLRTHARAQLVSAEALSKAIEQNTTLQQFTSICVGCNKVWASLRRNQVMSRVNKFLSDEETPVSLLPEAMHKVAEEKEYGASATFQMLERYFR
eukprot:scaffold3224_cov158-Amphora_coffeaeformis.AAC.21